MAPRAQLRIELLEPDTIARRQPWQLRVLAEGAPDSERLALVVDTIIFHLRDGSTLHARGVEPVAPLYTPPLPVPSGVRWVGERADGRGTAPSTVVTVRLTDEQARTLFHGVAFAELVGRVSVREPRVIATMPLGVEQTLTRDGRRFRIERVSHGAEGAAVELLTSAILAGERTSRAGGWRRGSGELGVALLNASRGEAMLLQQRTNSRMQSDWLVMPGASVLQESARYEPRRSWLPAADHARDDAWYAGAQLLIAEWIPLGSYPVRVRSGALE
jgi:hypothetical protein